VKKDVYFSVLHASARPERWRDIHRDWMVNARHPELVEYVLCMDERWGFTAADAVNAQKMGVVVCWNTGRRCYVDSVNTAARESSGLVLVVNADDQFSLPSWDEQLRARVPDSTQELRDDFVFEVSTGTPEEHERGIFVMPVLSRARYRRLGSVFYPLYESMYADNDFAAHAKFDGVVIGARDLVFPHRHPINGGAVVDDVYKAQNRPEAYRLGSAVYSCRRSNGFSEVSPLVLAKVMEGVPAVPEVFGNSGDGRSPDAVSGDVGRTGSQLCAELRSIVLAALDPVAVSSGDASARARESLLAAAGDLERRLANLESRNPALVDRRTIALCLSGESFRGEWVDAMLTLYTHLLMVRGFNVIRVRGYTTNVYVTRLEIWDALRNMDARPDFLLWFDDDNLVSVEHFDRLLSDIEARPDVDIVAGWCWVHDRFQQHFQPSCGTWAPDGVHWVGFDAVEFAGASDVRPVEVTGFPCLLMRGSIVDKIDERPFLRGILDSRLLHGIGGEDLAFCRACRDAGVLMVVDAAVRVPHLKYMQVVPEFVGRPEESVRLAVMLRVRNEARWISRVVESYKGLGPVFVMDDHSTDNTVELAFAAGAMVWPSPFPADELDEKRDKNWLLEQVSSAYSPNWIFCPDGDEELQRGGADRILRACASGIADAFAVKFLYLWDSPTHARLDRWYSDFSRFSLFRVRPGLTFKSLYEGRGVHAGLHTGNAPLSAEATKTALLNVYLLHYGYMSRADRLRKYEYYNRVDPHNEIEDCYRHIVQGDVPEVPASAVLKYAGPLDVRPLPASLAPQWEGVPVL
jgi:hypothetical protein